MSTTLHDLDPQTAHDWLQQGKAQLIDVREDHEHAMMTIPHSHLLPKSRFSSDRLPPSHGQVFIFSCKAGVRSKHCAHTFMEETGEAEAYHIAGGIDAWASQGFRVETSLATRYRVQTLVSWILAALIFVSIPLGYFVHWAFFIPLYIWGLFRVHTAITDTNLIEWYLERFVKITKTHD